MGVVEGRCCCSQKPPIAVHTVSGDEAADVAPESVSAMKVPESSKASRAESRDLLADNTDGPDRSKRRPSGSSVEGEEDDLPGELPDHAALSKGMLDGGDSVFDSLRSNVSTTASLFDTHEYESMSKEQRGQARKVVKDAVRTMVRGRDFAVVAANGELKTCFVSLSRKLDKLKVSIGVDGQRRTREVPLASIVDIDADSDIGELIFKLASNEKLTFRLEDVDTRDKVAGCIQMLSVQARNARNG